MRNVNQRLRKVDRRLSQVDRRLGFLQARLYFQSMDSGWEEVPLLGITDLGVTPVSLKTGEAISARRYQCKVDRDSLQTIAMRNGAWAISPTGELVDRLLCVLESQSVSDKDTSGTLDFRIAQSISVNLPRI